MTDGAHPIPILRSFDEAKAKAFYCDFLGFRVDWEHRFAVGWPLYCQVSLGDCVLHLSEHHGDATPGSALRIGVGDVEAFAAALRAKRLTRRPVVFPPVNGVSSRCCSIPKEMPFVAYQ